MTDDPLMQQMVRLPESLRQRLLKQAGESKRSISAEIVFWIERGLASEEKEAQHQADMKRVMDAVETLKQRMDAYDEQKSE